VIQLVTCGCKELILTRSV